MDTRLPAHLEVAGLIRRVQADGGFAMVLQKGEGDAGTIIVVLTQNDENYRIFERMPQLDGTRKWNLVRSQDTESKDKITEYLDRRKDQDPDVWVVELDIANGERFIDLNPEQG